MNARSALRFAQYGFAALGIGALGYCADVWLRARLFQRNEAAYFDRQLAARNRGAIAHRIPRVASRPGKGGLVGRLEIPRVGISVMVVEGAGHDELERGAGHIPGTAFPSQNGNVGIAAHRDTWFRPLEAIHSGDTITLQTLEGLYRYQVSSTRIVRPEDVSVLYPSARNTLTLVTCYPFHYVGQAPERFIVRAVRL